MNINSRLGFITIILLAFFIILRAVDIWAKETLTLKLESARDEYVLTEPVKFKITFTNVSENEQRIVGIDQLGKYNTCIFFEITYPSGKKYRRDTHPVGISDFSNLMYSPLYRGEALASGERLVTYLYPNWTHGKQRREGIDVYAEDNDTPWITFPVVGEYKIRVVYKISSDYKYLYSKEDGLWSNVITINFHEPTAVEKEILEPVWYNDPHDLSEEPSGLQFLSSDRIKSLKGVIGRYPDHPMIKYPIYVLAWIYSYPRLGNENDYKPDKALELFNILKNDYPDFRIYEVRCGIANTYYHMGERQKAVQVVNETIAADSSFKDATDLILIKLDALYNHYDTFNWFKARHEGRDYFKEKTPVIEVN